MAGCSTGEEAYTLAIIFKEALAGLTPQPTFSLQIFATDLDRDAIEKARAGVYPANIAADVAPERLRRFFLAEEGGGYRIRKEIREMVTLAPQNLIMDPPFSRLDILICRNLLIYLSPELHKKLFPLFHYSLNPGGYLFLGSAETAGNDSACLSRGGKCRDLPEQSSTERAESAPSTTPFFRFQRVRSPPAIRRNLCPICRSWRIK